ncbi:hypothetical protein UlMin_044486 [Ulmus minor]
MEFDKFSSMKLLISVSVFSVFLSYSSLLNSFVSTVSLPSFSQSLDKNYVFLLFNGLLVFIVKNSGLIGKYPPGIVHQNDENDPKNSNTSGPKPHNLNLQKQASLGGEQVDLVDDVEEKAIESSEHLSKEEEEEEKEASIEGGGEEEEKEKEASIGKEEEEGIELLSTEELNKKCEDFIRRMRREIVSSRFRNY